MVLKTYRRQGAFLQGKQIEMPTPEKKAPNIWGDMLDKVSEKTEKLSKENYELGRATLINGVLETAYEQASDNPKRFNELVKSGFENGLNGLNEDTKKNIYELANDKYKMLQIKVGNNLNRRLDAENTQRITELANDAMYGETGIQATNALISNYITSGTNLEGNEVTLDEINTLVNQRNRQIARLKAMAGAKNIRGNNIIKDKALRKAIETENFDIKDQILENVSLMDYDTLKSFDENVFQDKKGFTDKTGIDEKGYNYLNKKIKSRRKELKEDDEREVITQGQFNAVAAIYRKSPNVQKEIMERLPEEYQKKLTDLLSGETRKQEMLITNDDADLLRQINNVVEIADTKYDGDKEYNDKFLTKIIDAEHGLKKYREYGNNDKINDIVDNVLYNAATDKLYGDVIGSFADSSAFGVIVKAHKLPQIDASNMSLTEYLKNDKVKERMLKEATLPIDPDPEGTLKAQISMAADAIRAQTKLGNDMQTTKDEGVRQELYDRIKEIKNQTNIQIIKRKNRPAIDDSEFDRCYNEWKAGKTPLFKNKFNGKIYKFIGLTDNGIIIEDN